jgi:hypothetical protein
VKYELDSDEDWEEVDILDLYEEELMMEGPSKIQK